jgi:hypothetical protein
MSDSRRLNELLGNAYETRKMQETSGTVTMILNYWETLQTGLKTEVIEFPSIEKGLEYIETVKARGISLNQNNYGFYKFTNVGAVQVNAGVREVKR